MTDAREEFERLLFMAKRDALVMTDKGERADAEAAARFLKRYAGQIGDAGAGPVGEAVAATDKALYDLIHPHVFDNGQTRALIMDLRRKGFIAHPVEVSGEVERDDVSGCEMNVGCIETGICYARAQGEPDRCARPVEQPSEVEGSR